LELEKGMVIWLALGRLWEGVWEKVKEVEELLLHHRAT
jgi:hypothetical protein